MVPEVAGRNRVSRLKTVVLPAPFGPISAWIEPRRTRRSMPSTATNPWNSFRSPRVSRITSPIIPCPPTTMPSPEPPPGLASGGPVSGLRRRGGVSPGAAMNGLRQACQGKHEMSRPAAEGHEAMMQVEACGWLVLGIDHERMNAELRTQRPHSCIPQQGTAETMAAIGPVDREAADARDRDEGVARELLRQPLRHVGQGDPARGQRVVTGNLGRFPVERHVAGGCPTADVLGDL